MATSRILTKEVKETSRQWRWLNAGLAVLSPEGRLLSCNPALRDWFAESLSSLENQLFCDILGKINPPWREAIATWLATTDPFTQLLLPGTEITSIGWIRITAANRPKEIFVHLDSTAAPRLELEEAGSAEGGMTDEMGRSLRLRLLRSEAQLDNLMRRWPGVIFSQRTDMSFHYGSPKLEEMTGYPLSDWMARPETFWAVIHEADVNEMRQQVRRTIQTGDTVSTSFRIRHSRTGRVAYILEHRQALRSEGGLLLGFEGVWLDVSRQTIAERRLSSAAWRDTLAVLTMGLAHDFGNILAGIHALAETLEPEKNGDIEVDERVGLIKRNSLQASELVRRVLSLHQGKPGVLDYADLNSLVTDFSDLVRKIIPRRIQFAVVNSETPLPVYVDSVELRQVFLNLAMNAVDAMPYTGKICCTTSHCTEIPKLSYLQGEFPRLPAICLAIEDNGLGIPARNLPNIFDPFFTTKPVNKGSGLGLYNARLFAEKHHGALSVDSTEGSGTLFRLWLPEADFTEIERVNEQIELRRRCILVVGTLGRSLDTTAEFLRRSGFFVVTESQTEKVPQLLDSFDYEFDGVLLQLVAYSDQQTGQLLEELKGRRPPIKTILQIIGRNADEIDTSWIRSASLTIPSDLPEPTFGQKMRELFERPTR